MEFQIGNNVSATCFDIKLPFNLTALSVIGCRRNLPISNFDEFSNDGFVYNNGVKTRKWYVMVDKFTVWKPKLEKLSYLEKHYFKVNKWATEKQKIHHNNIIAIFRDNNINYLFGEFAGREILVYFEEGNFVVWKDVNYEKDNKLIKIATYNQQFVEEYFYHLSRIKSYSLKADIFKKCLDKAIQNYIADNGYNNKVVQLTINNRIYIYIQDEDYKFKALAWPDDIDRVSIIDVIKYCI